MAPCQTYRASFSISSSDLHALILMRLSKDSSMTLIPIEIKVLIHLRLPRGSEHVTNIRADGPNQSSPSATSEYVIQVRE